MQILSERDDRPHEPDDDPLWQESSLFVWHDRASGLGGFWRLGQEPVVQAVNSCFGLFTHDGLRFRSNVTGVPMAPVDRGEAHMGWGPHLKVVFDGDARITADFPDCEASLRFTDFHPRFDYHTIAMPGQRLEGAAHHFEVSGRMTGRVRIGDRELEIDALGYRDRSWSRRDWSRIRGTRWWPCVFGPDLTTHIIHLVHEGRLLKVGYVWRGGRTIAIIDSDVVVQLESDALTPRAGEAVLYLETGEELRVRCDRTDGIVMHVRGYTAVETIGTAYLDGMEGMSNLEVCTNAACGSQPPWFAMGSNITDGLSHRSNGE
ncbi:MAG: hypothetical protein M0R03_02280 [Novosphingobium sp.]|nr:hypothetical protein [Novosphingobium sp.]